ncbi:MAG: hypothetical protein ACRDAG_03810 [Cetobacterium somerae]|uniref:Uncharacterized protein n=1 Tax=Cetobacterium somerae ATCC BAA-474 TaxID=1319815 RepID=U7VAA9_9FUSO|nr:MULTISPECIES: hypothetical protein [Cetobacterium]ERT68079.1 hypothetical protein HMPREF0202_02015 [Cetobacterium somerae ATCC BAA-474]MBC2853017.1 hypothetical protein [Cetobacterium sp. 2G large]MCQ9626981.1 hypothetical protein [Cetobacterium somerae]
MYENFFNDFIVNFYEKIEDEFEILMKKEKTKKLSVGNLEIDVIDYLDDSKTPIIETIKDGETGIEIFLKNKEQIPSPYSVEEIYHPFSLAVLVDKLIKKSKYVDILENFYVQSEELAKDFLKKQQLDSIDIVAEGFEIFAISKATGTYKIAEGVVTEILLINDRVFVNIKNEDNEVITAHVVECNAADLAMLLNNLLNKQ